MTALVTEHLPLVAGAPGGIKALRGLIQELALRGKLTPQDQRDSPASALLREIAEEQAELIAKGLVRQPKQAPELDPNSAEFDLPDSWEWASVAALVLQITDGTHHTPTYLQSGIPFISVKDIDGKTIKFDGCKYISIEEHREINARCNPEVGDILLCRIGTLGRPTIVDTSHPFSLFVSVGLLKLPKRSVIAKFLHLALSSPVLYRQYEAIKAGGSHTNKLNLGDIPRLCVPVPPLAEQHRIVAKVDELMALCDRLEANEVDAEAAHAQLVQALLGSLTLATDAADFRAHWQRLSEHFHTLFTTEASIDALKQTVLQLAVMGKLVPHEAAVLDAAGALPPGWREQLINDFCSVQGGIQKTPLRRPVSQHFPYLRVANVQRGLIDVTELERYELTHDELAKWRLNTGDLLIVEGNGSENEIGRCAIWQGQVEDCVYQNHLMRVRPIVDDHVHYLALYLNSPTGIGHMKRLAITTSGLFNLSVGKIRSIPVPLPPLAEQLRIVAKVDELMALCDQLKAQLADARQQHAQLATALIEQAVA